MKISTFLFRSNL